MSNRQSNVLFVAAEPVFSTLLLVLVAGDALLAVACMLAGRWGNALHDGTLAVLLFWAVLLRGQLAAEKERP